MAEGYAYTAFGQEQRYGSPLPNPWHFSSKRLDPESGWIYFGRRYYSPAIGRWTTPDPIGFADGPNLYAYVSNNPLTHFDLYGLNSVSLGLDQMAQHAFNTYANSGTSHSSIGSSLASLGAKAWDSWTSHLGKMAETTALVGYHGPTSGLTRLASTSYLQWTNTENPFKYNDPPSSAFTVPGKDHGYGIIWISGQVTDVKESYEQCLAISKMAKGSQVTGIHTQTSGVSWDTYQSFRTIVTKDSPGGRLGCNELKRELRDRGSYCGRVILGGHSRGALDAYCAAIYDPSVDLRRVHFVGVGGAHMVAERGFAQALNYVGTGSRLPSGKSLVPVEYPGRC